MSHLDKKLYVEYAIPNNELLVMEEVSDCMTEWVKFFVKTKMNNLTKFDILSERKKGNDFNWRVGKIDRIYIEENCFIIYALHRYIIVEATKENLDLLNKHKDEN